MAQDKYLQVADVFRTNELSFRPGGYTVHVVYKDGQVRIYDKVKAPKRYIQVALTNEHVKEAYVVEPKN